MSERRTSIAPPEMMKGSISGSASSNSSALATRMRQVEEPQLSTAAVDHPLGFKLQQAGDEAVPRVENQVMQCALGPGSFPGRELVEGQLEERMELDSFAPAPGVGQDVAP